MTEPVKLPDNRFAPRALTVTTEPAVPQVYSSGYSEEEILLITIAHKKLSDRNLKIEPVTLEEFKTIVVPWQRIHRTEAFNLNPDKVKAVRQPKEPSARKPRASATDSTEPKVPKLTKKFIAEKLSDIIFQMAAGETISDGDMVFFTTHTSKEIV